MSNEQKMPDKPIDKPAEKPKVSARWLGIEQVWEYFGGILSREEVEHLMKNNHIKSWWKKRRIVTHIKNVEQWDDDIRRARDTDTTKMLGAGYIIPVSYVLKNETGRRGTV